MSPFKIGQSQAQEAYNYWRHLGLPNVDEVID